MQLLWAETTDDHELRISLLCKGRRSFALYRTEGSFEPERHEDAERWTSTLMETAYEGE